MTTDRRDRRRGARMVCAAVLCVAFVAAAVGCGTSPKRRIAFSKKQSRQSNSRYVVRGQSDKQPPNAHKGIFIWPLDTFVFMSPYGIRRGRRHDGVDLSAKGGSPVKAAADGEVVFSKRMRGYGNLILIKHDHDYFTAYAHNSKNIACKGKKVKQGDKIALVGRTGRATGNHVHFEIRKGQRAMDPLNFLPARAGVLVKKEGAKKKSTVAAKTGTKSKAKIKTTSKKATVAKKTAKPATTTTVAKKSTAKSGAKTKVATPSKATAAKKNPTKVATASKATVAKKTAKPATTTAAKKTAAPKTASSSSMTPKAAKIKGGVANLQKKPANAPKTTVAKSPEISSKKASPKDAKPAVEKNAGPKVAKKSGKAMSNK